MIIAWINTHIFTHPDLSLPAIFGHHSFPWIPLCVYLFVATRWPHRQRTVAGVRHWVLPRFLPPKNQIIGVFIQQYSRYCGPNMSFIIAAVSADKKKKVESYWIMQHMPRDKTRSIRTPLPTLSAELSFGSVKEKKILFQHFVEQEKRLISLKFNDGMRLWCKNMFFS